MENETLGFGFYVGQGIKLYQNLCPKSILSKNLRQAMTIKVEFHSFFRLVSNVLYKTVLSNF